MKNDFLKAVINRIEEERKLCADTRMPISNHQFIGKGYIAGLRRAEAIVWSFHEKEKGEGNIWRKHSSDDEDV